MPAVKITVMRPWRLQSIGQGMESGSAAGSGGGCGGDATPSVAARHQGKRPVVGAGCLASKRLDKAARQLSEPP